MKRLKYLILSTFTLFTLLSCNRIIEDNTSSKYVESSTTTNKDNETTLSSTNQVETNINLRKNKVDETNYKTYTLDKSNRFSGGYNSGNFGVKDSFEYYRTYCTNYKIMTTLLKTPTYLKGEMNSNFYNKDEIKGIFEVDITYKSDKGFTLYYSTDRSYNNSYKVLSSNDFITLSIKIDLSNFIKIETLGEAVDIESFTIKYDDSTSSSNTSYLTYSDYRIDIPYTDFDNITSGTKRSIADSIIINSDNTYTINSYKEYTYYTIDDVLSGNVAVNDVALTDAVDVANYYTLFHAFPLNYGYSSDTSDLSTYFGSNTRQISKYMRTDGYAKAVPYYAKFNPTYYELDFSEDGTYTTSSRGKGRLVVWEEGFKGVEYMGQAVIVYTDDHYATFKEYNNYGSFGTRFNAERAATSYNWSKPTTLTKSK